MTSFPASLDPSYRFCPHLVIFENRDVVSGRSGLLPSQSVFRVPGHLCEHLGIRVPQTVSLAARGPKHEARNSPSYSVGPAALSLPGGRGISLSYRGISVTDRALCKLTWFTQMCTGQANRKKE